MANETVVRVTADASGYASALEKAQRSNQAFLSSVEAAAARTKAAQDAISEAAENGSNSSSRSINAFIQSLSRQADAVGKSRSELLQLQAAQMGVASSAQPFIDKIKAAEDAMTKGGHAAEGLNFSTTAARRELLVLAHEASQGNWSKFGGSIMVLGERIDAMGMIFSAAGATVAIVAAEIAAFGIAAIKGAEETKQFNAALVMTSNFAGLTRQSFIDMTDSLSKISGASLGTASDVLMDLAKSGQYTSAEMVGLGNVIVQTSKISGAALKDVGKEYENLAEDPAKWADEHNRSMHFMDVATYQHITALQEAGDKHKAVQAVIEAATAQVEASSTKHLSVAAQAWHELSAGVQTVWANLKQGLSGGPTLQNQIDTLLGEKKDIQGNSLAASRVAAIDEQVALLQEQQRMEQKSAESQARIAQIQQDGIEAAKQIDKMRDQLMSNAQRRQKELAQLAKDRKAVEAGGGVISDADYASMVAGINDKYKDKAPKPEKAYADDAATRFLQQLRDQDAALQAQVTTTGKMSEAEKELVKFDQQISDWKGKTLTADQKSLLSRQDELRAQLQVNVAHAKAVEQQEAINKLKERSAQIDASVASYQDKQRDQYGRQLEAFGMGSEAMKTVQAVKSIYAEYQRLQEQLDKATPKNLIGGADYVKASADIKAGLDQSLKDYDDYYSALRDKQADWQNGALSGLADYLDSAHNVAKQAESAFSNAAKGMEDALVTFVTTGKLNFTSLADSIIADIVRMQARAAISGLLSSLVGMIGGAVGGGITGSFGSLPAASSAASDVMTTGYSSGVMGPSSMMPTYASLPQRAAGGPVADGTGYLVGEHGPEMFVPGKSGSIVPNHALAGGGGGVSVQIVNNSNAQVQQPQVSQDSSGQRFIRLIIDQAKNEIAGDMAGGQGNVSKALTQRYGLTPRFR